MSDEQKYMDFMVPGFSAFTSSFNGEQHIETPIRTERLFEHTTDSLDLDMSLEEHQLAAKYPLEYDRQVNGITHILVRDADTELRYEWKDGSLVQIKEGF